MPESVLCNLCGEDNFRLLYTTRDYRLQVDDEEWNVVQCRSCGLGYLNPRPTPAEIGRYYPSSYFSGRGSHTARYEREARYLNGPPGRLLDIGTARGDFPALMRNRGWNVEGLEAFDTGNPHGLAIHRMHFPDEAPSETYDVITAWAVFEHLRDPARAFEACSRMLAPTGRLIVQVPNLQSIWARLAKQEDIPRHLHFFSKRTLNAYARRNGLKLIRFTHTTDLFGGSGRGVLRLWMMRAFGYSETEFYEFWRTSRRERFRRPFLATAWIATSALERILLSDWLVRRAHLSGQVLAEFEKASPNTL